MLSRRSVCLSLGTFAMPGFPLARPSKIVSVADFGAKTGVADVGPMVKRALASIAGVHDVTLQFPSGNYRFAAENGFGMHVVNQINLTIAGIDAELVFDGLVAPLKFERCPGLTLSGFSVDWGTLPYVQGDVLQVAPDLRSIVLGVDAICAVRGDEHFGRIGLYDRATKCSVPHGLDKAGVIIRVETDNDQRLNLFLPSPIRLRPHDTLVLRPAHSGPPVVSLTECDDFSVNHVRIHASPGMAITAFACRGGSIQDVTVGIKPGTSRLLSSNADAVHLLSCSGEISVRDCLFEGMGDDGINIAAPFFGVVRVGDDPCTASLRTGADRFSFSAIRDGDRVHLVRGADLATIDEMTIEHRDEEIVHFDRAIPWGADASLYIVDSTRIPKAQILNSRFIGNRARGILVHCDAVIEGCSFDMQSSAAVLLAPDLMWREGPRVERVSVRNNLIRRSNTVDGGGGAVRVGAFLSPDGRSEISASGVINRDIDIDGNSFEDCHASAIFASSVQNLQIVNNHVARCGEPAISVSAVRGLELSGNSAAIAASIALRGTDKKSVVLDANANMSLICP